MTTIRELYEALQDLDQAGELDSQDGQIRVVFQPNYPLVTKVRGFGFIDETHTLTLIFGTTEASEYPTLAELGAADSDGDIRSPNEWEWDDYDESYDEAGGVPFPEGW